MKLLKNQVLKNITRHDYITRTATARNIIKHLVFHKLLSMVPFLFA